MTTQAKHTKGPWETSVNSEGKWDVCQQGGGDMIADLSQCDNGEANARLIALAPKMADALRQITEAYREFAPFESEAECKMYDAARALLTKLDGAK